MSDDIIVRPDFVVPDEELEWRFSTSSGPGGQHANRSNTRAELRWRPGDSRAGTASQRSRVVDRLGELIIVQADDRRSQLRNRELALERFIARVKGALHVDAPRRATKPSRSAKRRRADDKKRRGQLKRQRRRPGPDD